MSTSENSVVPVPNVTRPTHQPPAAPEQPATGSAAPAPAAAKPASGRRRLAWGIGAILLLLALGAAWPSILNSFETVSTDDAYVNGHVTFVAPRVAGQVIRVLVDDNNRVRKGDLLVQLDRQPFQVQVDIAQSAVAAAQSDVVTAQAQAMGVAAQARSLRFRLDHAIEDVDNQVALLHSRVATLASDQATLDNAKRDYEKVQYLFQTNASTQKELDDYRDAYLVAQAKVEEGIQGVYEIRVNLGLPPRPPNSNDLTQVPADLNQTASTVRQAQFSLIQAVVQLGVVGSFSQPPRQMIADFYKRDPQGNIDRILTKLVKSAPAVLQAHARCVQAQRLLDQANLNLSYCDVVSDIDGVVTRRNVNPGDNIVVGQSIMAVRSLTEIWIDANFKETQLRQLRIGQGVDIEADMYGSHEHFRGRISGFTMGTGSTLALLPPENATGNFVKVVQRLPVRIDLIDYDPDKNPLFIGLSVTPYVQVNQPPTGPDAGNFLQPYQPDSQLDLKALPPSPTQGAGALPGAGAGAETQP